MVTNLKQKAFSGAKWTTISAIIVSSLQIIQLVIVSRILPPESLGLMTTIMVVVGFAQLYSDMGITNAIIYKESLTGKQLSSLYWFNLMLGLLLTIFIIGITPVIADFYHEPKLKTLLYLIAVIFLINPIGQQSMVLHQKELKFNILAKIEILAAISGFILTIALAYGGYDVYSLVVGQIFIGFVKMCGYVFISKNVSRPMMYFKFSEVKSFISFGLYQLGERTVHYINSNLDYIIIGSLLGSKALGYYTIAFNLIILPISKINPIVTRVAFPVFSKIQNNIPLLKSSYFKVIRVLSFINFPYFFGLFISAPILVPVVFGEKWMPSVVLIQILAFVGMTRAIVNPIGALVMARGRVDLGFKWHFLMLFSQVPLIVIGAYLGGITGVAIGYSCHQVIYVITNYSFVIRTLVGSCLKEFLESFIDSIKASLAMLGTIFIMLIFIKYLDIRIQLIMIILLGVASYIAASLVFQRRLVMELKEQFFKKKLKNVS
ncbi:MOP flippase family protein [Bacillus nitratireducens]|uniref:MOP flippase family protein n=1 Tax=Bacillus nitratireducens TaxID=2026193 RepID=UPI003396FBDF